MLGRDFYLRPSPEVARDLLGCFLYSAVGVDTGGEPVIIRLTEVEAYAGEADPASHAFRGRTVRNEVMFGEGGHLYRYLIYGMYWCANVVTGPPGISGGVLLRAGEVVTGEDLARSRRPRVVRSDDLASGPGKLTAALGWDRSDQGPVSGEDLCRPTGVARILAGTPIPDEEVSTGPRVGVAAAKDVPWRYWTAGHATVSKYRLHQPRVRPT